MDMDFGPGRVVAAILSAASAVQVAAVQAAEQSILWQPQSFVFAAMAGALIGVVILPNKEASRVAPEPSWPWWRKGIVFAVRAAALAIAVLSYALLAAASINVVVILLHGIEAAGVSFSLILGVFIRPLLPKYMAGVEGITERLLGGIGPK